MQNKKITIVDYGVGNLHSLKKAFNFFDADAKVSEDRNDVLGSDAVVLPGVGAFEAGMRGLRLRGLIDAVKKIAAENKPILGICLGAQLLLSEGREFGVFEGLGIIPGKVVRFSKLDGGEKIPQVGWNKIYAPQAISWQNTIFDSVARNSPDFYFVHSYILEPDKKENVFGLTTYGGHEFCSVIKLGSIYGCQFHPERSGKKGLEIIKNFIELK